jgi:hypothetical protein
MAELSIENRIAMQIGMLVMQLVNRDQQEQATATEIARLQKEVADLKERAEAPRPLAIED